MLLAAALAGPVLAAAPARANAFPVSGLAAGNSPLSVNGGTVSCALDSSQQAQCWGLNTDGELGDGSLTSMSTAPVPVTGR